MDIQWEDPPEYAKVAGSGSNPGKHVKFAVALREHPGRWARLVDAGVKTHSSALAKAQNIRRGKVKGFQPAGAYEAAVDEEAIWVRYVAQPEEPGKSEEPEPEEQDPRRPRPRVDAREPSVGEVRAWARGQGLDVPERGRLPHDLFERYAEAHA